MPAPKKSQEARQSRVVQFRMTEAHHEAFTRAAGAAGQSLSDWMRTRLLQAARAEAASERT